MWALLARHAGMSGAPTTAAQQQEALSASLWSPQHPQTQRAGKKANHCPGLPGCCSFTTHLLWVVLIAEEFQCVDASIKRPLQAPRQDDFPSVCPAARWQLQKQIDAGGKILALSPFQEYSSGSALMLCQLFLVHRMQAS